MSISHFREEINETPFHAQEKMRSQEPSSLRAARMYFQSSREWPGPGNLRAGFKEEPRGADTLRLHRKGKQREPQCPRLDKGEVPQKDTGRRM